ncbi:DNA cross-link repair protein [Martiniozyma asiatica (nom. inval.)]|nr:DNA cross-link repair protein [Martiniozyma asiatica]
MNNKPLKQRTLFDFISSKNTDESNQNKKFASSSETVELNYYRCPICMFDLTHFAYKSREVHVNKCIDPQILQSENNNLVKGSVYPDFNETHTDLKLEFKEHEIIDAKPEIKQERILRSTVHSFSFEKESNNLADIKVEEQQVHEEFTVVTKRRKTKPKPPIPQHKILSFETQTKTQSEGDILAVDAFCYEQHPNILIYLLTHFHSDHYGGMCKSWPERTGAKYILCTPVTARLVKKIYGIGLPVKRLLNKKTKAKGKEYIVEDPDCEIIELPYLKPIKIPNTNITITALDANHCPGAGIFIIECKNIRYLHCGDFRVSKEMIKQILTFGPLERCYLDTTYLNPMYSFPKQDNVVKITSNWIIDKFKTYKSTQSRVVDFFSNIKLNFGAPSEFMIVIGTYSVGKEKLAFGIAKTLNSKIYCTKEKFKLLSTYEWPELLEILTTENPENCLVHLLPMAKTKKEEMSKYLCQYSNKFKSVLVIHPTGWTFNWKGKAEQQEIFQQFGNEGLKNYVIFDPLDVETSIKTNLDSAFESFDRQQKHDKSKKGLATYRKVLVPYSEHSSFRELFYFVNLLQVEKWITTVNKSKDDEQEQLIAQFRLFPTLDLENF